MAQSGGSSHTHVAIILDYQVAPKLETSRISPFKAYLTIEGHDDSAHTELEFRGDSTNVTPTGDEAINPRNRYASA